MVPEGRRERGRKQKGDRGGEGMVKAATEGLRDGGTERGTEEGGAEGGGGTGVGMETME